MQLESAPTPSSLRYPILLIVIASWLVLLAWIDSPYVGLMGHSGLANVSSLPSFLFFSLFFLLGWGLMIAAMMFPSLVPAINRFRQKASSTLEQRHLSVYPILGYLVSWMIFGMVLFVLDFGIHRIVESSFLSGQTWIFAFSALGVAGTYELTPFKRNFIVDSCYPGDLLRTKRYNGAGRIRAFDLGMSYGKTTIGCNWALMLLMFSLGMGNLLWMVFFGIVMGAERLSPESRTRFLLGAFLIGIAFLSIAANVIHIR